MKRLLRPLSQLVSSSTSRDSFYSLAGQTVASLAGFVFFAWSARLLTLSQFGIFSLALATAAIIKDIIDPALNSSLIKFIAQGKDAAQQITRYVLQIKFVYFGLIIGLALLFPLQLSQLIFRQQFGILLVLTVITSATVSTSTLVSGFLQGHRQFLLDAIFVALQPLVRLLLLGLLVWWGRVGIIELLVVNVLAYLVLIGLFASAITYEYLSGDIEPLTKSAANKFIGPLTLSTIAGVLTDRIGLFITNYLLGPAQVGLLSAVLRLFIPAQQIAGVLSSVFGTRFASFTSEEQANRYITKALSLIAPVIAAAIIASLGAPWILAIFGPEYVQGTWLLRIITLGFCGLLIQVPFVAKLVYYKNRTDVMVYVSVLQLGLTLIGNLVLIKLYGLTGAAIATTSVFASVAIVYGCLSYKLGKK